jgi:hypothetical protein
VKLQKSWKALLWAAGIAFSLLPIAFTYLNGRLDGRPPEWKDLLAGGELLLISAALAADAVSNALVGGQRYRMLRYICGLSCFFVVASTSAYFARISYSMQERRDLLEAAVRAQNWQEAMRNMSSGMDRFIIARDSLWFFGITLVAALGVILMEED